ncbi:MAG: lysophospholipid acyltransferase family protein [Planctomycetales bacterium]|nr:lysophospholipid acyltransferase family protein [Planctomycetales bacterium]
MPARGRQLADYAAYVLLRCAITMIQAAPLGLCARGAELLGWLFGSLLGFRRRLVDENLQVALPAATAEERREVARRMWKHLFLMVVEIAHAQRKVHRETWRDYCRIPELKKVVSVTLQDRPKVIISGHYSNFEFGGYLLGLFGFPSYTVARTLDNPYVDKYVNDFRGRTGQHILPKQGSRDAIEQVLGSGGTLALLGDQAAGDKSCWVNFFGKPASTHKAVALFTLGYYALTMVMGTRRTTGPLRFEIDLAGSTDPLSDGFELGSVPALAEWYTRGLEEIILRAPDQYWWVHRRWKGTPPPRVLKRLERLPTHAIDSQRQE